MAKNKTTADKANEVFQCGLGFRIWNKPVQFDQIWDIRLFWIETFFHTDEDSDVCPPKGFATLDECLDNILAHIKKCEDNDKN